jgi:hypothetical protein
VYIWYNSSRTVPKKTFSSKNSIFKDERKHRIFSPENLNTTQRRQVIVTRQIKLFGLLTIEEDGQPAAVMKSPKGYALLVHLLITKKTHSREVLADLLWEARSTQESLRNLRQLLSRVKKVAAGTRYRSKPDWSAT